MGKGPGLVDTSGNSVASYTYDPYGKVLTATGELADKNPLRYRGYYYDSESGLYYLQSRYYDPATRRFINADAYASTGQGLLGCNMFVYCNNNFINWRDIYGLFPSSQITQLCLFDDSERSLPKEGEPNSLSELYNPDGSIKQKRWYGPDGKAIHDRDYNHSGNVEFPHDHSWENGKRKDEHEPLSPQFQFQGNSALSADLMIFACFALGGTVMILYEAGNSFISGR